MVHIWWECPKIKEYWQEIVSNIKEITGEKIGQNIWTCLFHDYNPKETIHENNNLKTPECCKGSDPQKMVK